jgi:hypothetical protein
MSVRILGEGQLQVDDAAAAEISGLDAALENALAAADEETYRPALVALLARVRELGTPVAADAIAPSDLIVPHEGASMAEVHDMLAENGTLPGQA